MIRFELQLSLTKKKKNLVFFPLQAYLWKDGLRGKSQSEALLLFHPYPAWQGVGDREPGGLLWTERHLEKLRLWWQATTHLF